jgi:hypothetical protein
MDYNWGTSLIKHQWDGIHDPGLVIGLFERDEDAMMAVSDNFKVKYILGQLQCAYQAKAKNIYVPYGEKSIKSTIQINGGKINVEIIFPEITKGETLFAVSGDKLFSGRNISRFEYGTTYYEYNVSDEMKIVANHSELDNYINNDHSEDLYSQLQQHISQKENDKAFELLEASSYCLYSKLQYSDVSILLGMIAEKSTHFQGINTWSIPEKDELKIINLLRVARNFSEVDKVRLVEDIGVNKWYEVFDSGIDDVGGVDYHTEFLKLLLELCIGAYSYYPDWKTPEYTFNCQLSYTDINTFREVFSNSSYTLTDGMFTLVSDNASGYIYNRGSNRVDRIQLLPTDPISLSRCFKSQGYNQIVVPSYVLFYLIRSARQERWTSIAGELLDIASFAVAVGTSGSSVAVFRIASQIGIASNGMKLLLSDESIVNQLTKEQQYNFNLLNRTMSGENTIQNFLDPSFAPQLLAALPACITALSEIRNKIDERQQEQKKNLENMIENLTQLQNTLKNENVIY